MLKLTLNNKAKLLAIAIGGFIAWKYLRKRQASISLSGKDLDVELAPLPVDQPPAQGKDLLVHPNPSIQDTITTMHAIVRGTLYQTKSLAKQLYSADRRQALMNLFKYIVDNFKYKNDELGLEQLREPARSLKDRKTGVDCDCFSILIASVLTNWNIPFVFRVVAYKEEKGLSHVYPMAILDNEAVALDVVSRKFNYQKEYLYKIDV